MLFTCHLFIRYNEWPWPHLVVTAAEEVLSEAVCDCGARSQDFGHAFAADHHVPVVELNIHIRFLIQQIVGAAGRSEADQLPVITVQLVATRSLRRSPKFICNSSLYNIFNTSIEIADMS